MSSMEKERGAFGVSLHDGLFAAVLGMREFVDEAIWSGSQFRHWCCLRCGEPGGAGRHMPVSDTPFRRTFPSSLRRWDLCEGLELHEGRPRSACSVSGKRAQHVCSADLRCRQEGLLLQPFLRETWWTPPVHRGCGLADQQGGAWLAEARGEVRRSRKAALHVFGALPEEGPAAGGRPSVHVGCLVPRPGR